MASIDFYGSSSSAPPILHEPAPTIMPDNGDDFSSYQQPEGEEQDIPYDVILFAMLSLLLTLSVGRLGLRKAREYQEANNGASMFDRSSRRRLQLPRQLEVQQTVPGGYGRTSATRTANGRTNAPWILAWSALEIAQRTQILRDAYLDTFQRNQVQLTIQKEDMSSSMINSSDSLEENVVLQAAVVDDANHDHETEQVQEDMETGEIAVVVDDADHDLETEQVQEDIETGEAADVVDDADHDLETEQVQEDIETGETTAASKTSSGDGTRRATGWQPRTIQSGCAICLDPYEVGDDIVWSSNEQCRHAFHQDCVLDYFLHLQKHDKEEEEDIVAIALLSAPCPCCRQSFCQPNRLTT